jgi:hypothetical protein
MNIVAFMSCIHVLQLQIVAVLNRSPLIVAWHACRRLALFLQHARHYCCSVAAILEVGQEVGVGMAGTDQDPELQIKLRKCERPNVQIDALVRMPVRYTPFRAPHGPTLPE